MTGTKNKIAIIGVSGKFPEAENLHELGENLEHGRDSVRPISQLRRIYSCLDLDKNYYPVGHLDRVDLFDHAFFEISKLDAELMHPEHRLLLELALEAIENAGYALSSFRGSNTMIYIGGGNKIDYAKMNRSAEAANFTGNLSSMIAGRIAYLLDLRGGAMMIDTSCSSSLVAVHEVCRKLMYGEADMALAGGINLMTSFPEHDLSLDTLGICSPDGKSKAFDTSADGTGIGEGGGILLLKRLDKALQDGDCIQAVILGSAINSDGGRSNGLTAPSPLAQKAVIESALRSANLSSDSISYIEAHGTGTKLGDPIEFTALSEVFSAAGMPVGSCALGAIKTNLGHLGSGAGIAGLLKCVLSLKRKKLFPSLHFDCLSPFIDFEESPLYVNTEVQHWEPIKDVRRCGVSSFGLTGTNAHVILEEAPERNLLPVEEDSVFFLKISARSISSLKQYLDNIIAFLQVFEGELHHVLFTLNAGRDDYEYRLSVTAKTKEELLSALTEKKDEWDAETTENPIVEREVVLLFSEKILNIDTIHHQFSHYQKYYKTYHGILELVGKEALHGTLKVFAVQVALYRLWETWGMTAKTVIATGVGRIAKQVIFGEVSVGEAVEKLSQEDIVFPSTDLDKLREVTMALNPSKIIFLEVGFSGVLIETMNQWKNLDEFKGLYCEELGKSEQSKAPWATLMVLYERGVEIDWGKFYQDKNYQRVEVPTYPFDQVRCWTSPPLELTETDPSQWTYHLSWEDAPLPLQKQSAYAKKYLLFMDAHGLGEQMVSALSKEGVQCVKVFSGSGFQKVDDTTFYISWENESEYRRLFTEVAQEAIPDVIVHLGNVGLPTSAVTDQVLAKGLYSQFYVAKALSDGLSQHRSHFVVVSTNAQKVEKVPSTHVPEYAASYGFLAGILEEYQNLSATCIDIDMAELDHQNIKDLVLSEMSADAGMLSVCYRKGRRFLPEVKRLDIVEEESPLKSGGVYVVTGGAKGIGLEIVKDIANLPRVTIIVIGRSSLPPEENWVQIAKDSDSSHQETIKTFLDLRAGGTELRYCAVDVGDVLLMKTVAENIKSEYGSVDGVIHLAGVPGKKKVADQSLDDFKEALIPKVHGTKNIFDSFSGDLKFYVMFSSLAAIHGYERSANYGAANVYQDNFAKKLSEKGVRALSINWPGWKETGMLHRILNTSLTNDLQWLNTSEGLASFHHSMKSSNTNVIISKIAPSQMGRNPYVLFGKTDKNQSTPQPICNLGDTRGTFRDENRAVPSTQSEIKEMLRDIWYRVLKNDSISDEDDFFEIGGHSINGMRMVNLIGQELKIELEIEDLYDCATINKLTLCIAEKGVGADIPLSHQQIVSSPQQKVYPVSNGQKRLWLMSQVDSGSIAYNEPGAYMIEEAVDREAVENALKALVVRHESLRTVFENREEDIVQIIKDPDKVNFKLTYSDLRSEKNKDIIAQKLANAEALELFDLQNGPLFRARLIQLAEERFLFIFVMHHIISDRWSVMLLAKEFLMLYESFLKGLPDPLLAIKVQYKDYVLWQNNQLKSEHGQAAKAYWKKQFSGQIPRLELPLDFPRPAQRSFRGDSLSIRFGQEVKTSLSILAKEEEVSLYMVAVASVTTLLYKHTGQTDIILGSPVSGRLHRDFENQIGIFINILALRIVFSAEESFALLLKEVKKVVLGALKHQIFPYDLLLESLGIGLDRSRASTLFDVGIDFFSLNEEVDEIPAVFQTTNYDTGFRSNTFDLRFRFIEHEDSLTLTVDYNTDLFSKQRIDRMLAQYEKLMEGIVTRSDTRLKTLEFIPREEREALLYLGRPTSLKPKASDVMALFEIQVKKQADAIAFTDREGTMTYHELDRHTSYFAHCLLEEPSFAIGDIVAVSISRSANVLIALLGVFKAGGVYMPIERKYPTKRIDFILEDSNAKVLVLDKGDNLQLEFSGSVIRLEPWKCLPVTNDTLSTNPLATEPAYIIYTSGSSGEPKGCFIQHQSLVTRISYFIDYLQITPNSKVLQLASYGFDASLFEIFISLLSGAELVLAGEEEKEDSDALLHLMQEYGVTVATFPPAVLNIIGQYELSSLKTIISTGEAVILKDGLFYSQFLAFYNGYGPTETCIGASFYKLDLGRRDYYLKTESLPIGKPFAETGIYILDERMELVPRGNTGSIYISGTGVALGYINQPELTCERFLNNPFSTDEGDVLYKSGDLGRWNDHGDLEYKGREDSQVQVNGIRVELEEIRQVILTSPDIAKAAVVLKEDHTLAAFAQRKRKVQLWPDVNTVNVFDQVLYHSMGEDKIRLQAFRKVFNANLKDKTVIDVGTGENALLAIMAAQAGAKKVYAVEVNENASLKAKEKVEELGLCDTVEIINADIRSVELPEKVDFCIFDISGNTGGSGGAAVLINSAKRLIKSPQSILPKRYLTKVAGISLPEEQVELFFSEIPGAYVKRMFEKKGYSFDLRLCLKHFPLDRILTGQDVFEDLNFEADLEEESKHDIQLTCQRNSIFHGLLLSLDVTIEDGLNIDNLQEGDVVLPVFIPLFWPGIVVEKGDVVRADITRNTSDNGVNPDYFIKGEVHTSTGVYPFDYRAYNHEKVFRGNAFYERLFEGGEVMVRPEYSEHDLKDYLRERLPLQMVPQTISLKDKLPLTLNGKIDTKKLLQEVASVFTEDSSDVSPLEREIINIWESILTKNNIQVTDNFFKIGGHSLKATQLISRIHKKFGVKCDLKDIFRHSTVQEMAKVLAEKSESVRMPIVPLEKQTVYEVSHAQRRVWALSQLEEASLSYNISSPFILEGPLNILAFMESFDALVERHESLRTVFLTMDGEPYQKILTSPSQKSNVNVEDYTDKPQSWELVANRLEQELTMPFDLENGPLFRLRLFKMSEEKHVFVFSVHHIIFDAWSMDVLIKEFSLLYEGYHSGEPKVLKPLGIHYKDFTAWQNAQMDMPSMKQSQAYWEGQFKERPPALKLPWDKSRPHRPTYIGGSAQAWIEKDITDQLRGHALEENGSLFMVMVAMVKILLYKYTGESDITVGIPVTGRDHLDLENQIGFYLNTLALRTSFSGEDSFKAVLREVIDTITDGFRHQAYPFDRLIHSLDWHRLPGRSALFDVHVVFQNGEIDTSNDLEISKLKIKRFTGIRNLSKFDLEFIFTNYDNGLALDLYYSDDLFERGTVELMMERFQVLIQNLLQKVSVPLSRIDFATDLELGMEKPDIEVDFDF